MPFVRIMTLLFVRYLTHIIFVLALSSCAIKREPDYKNQAQILIKNSDWEKATTVTISMVEFFFQIEFVSEEEFAPYLEFEHLKPYKLKIKNDGLKLHSFTSPDFFSSIEILKIVSAGKEQLFPEPIDGYVVFPKKSTEIFFVPYKKGKFLLFCSVGIHRKMGMHRMIIVK